MSYRGNSSHLSYTPNLLILLHPSMIDLMATKVNAPLAKPIKKAVVQSRTISIRTQVFRTYVGLAAIILVILTGIAHVIPYFSWDLEITKFLQGLSAIGSVLSWVSWPGYFPQSLVIIATVILSLAVTGLYWEAVTMALGTGVTQLVVNLLKVWVGRVRPLASLVNVNRPISSGSFPSGHVVDYVVVLGFIWFVVFTSFKKSPWRKSFIIIPAILIILVGPSRVYLGEHWPSDVIGAYLLGSVLLWLIIEFYNWGKRHHILKSAIQQSSGTK